MHLSPDLVWLGRPLPRQVNFVPEASHGLGLKWGLCPTPEALLRPRVRGGGGGAAQCPPTSSWCSLTALSSRKGAVWVGSSHDYQAAMPR